MTIPDKDVHVSLIARLLLFIYTGNYQDLTPLADIDCAQFEGIVDNYRMAELEWIVDAELSIRMYNLGDYYDIKTLRNAATNSLLRAYHDATRPNVISDDGKMTNLEAEHYSAAIRLTYELTQDDDRTLKDISIRVIKVHIRHFDALAQNGIQNLLRDCPEFTLDLASVELESKGRRCNDCDQYTTQLSWRCKCGFTASCFDADCCCERTERSICTHCYQRGTIKYTPLKGLPYGTCA